MRLPANRPEAVANARGWHSPCNLRSFPPCGALAGKPAGGPLSGTRRKMGITQMALSEELLRIQRALEG